MKTLAKLLEKYFYFFISLLIAGIIVYGFSHTIDQGLIHATPDRPLLLYIHAVVFCAWVPFLIFQSALVRTRNVRLHQQLGWFGAALGVAIPILGISTAITMVRFRIARLGAINAEPDLIIQFFDMIAFTTPFALAIYWRKRLEFHRRLILIASCALTSAAFGRFPPEIIPSAFFYAGVDFLICLGVIRDLIVNRRVHSVYLWALPVLILCQTVVMYVHSLYMLKIWSFPFKF